MAKFAAPARQAARVMQRLQGRVFPSVGTVRNYEQALTRVAEYARDQRLGGLRALLANPDNSLRPGMFVAAELVLPPEKDRLVVPSTAIQTTAAGDNVVVIRGPEASVGGQAEYVRVTVSRRLGDTAVVSEGLQAGDVIITEGQLKVSPGAQVQVTLLKSATGS